MRGTAKLEAHILQIGRASIPYTVRFSTQAGRKRTVVRHGRVEVVAPEGSPWGGLGGIEAFVRSKRAWVFRAVEDSRRLGGDAMPERYESGAKLLYRGRRLMLKVQTGSVEEVRIDCRSRFHVTAPEGLSEPERLLAIAEAFGRWLRERAGQDVGRMAKRYAAKLSVKPRDARISDQKRMWGTCGKDGVLRIHWQLIQAPVAAMEYVVAHEACHLLHRHHNRAFWRTLGNVMPDWRERKQLLEAWEREVFHDRMKVG